MRYDYDMFSWRGVSWGSLGHFGTVEEVTKGQNDIRTSARTPIHKQIQQSGTTALRIIRLNWRVIAIFSKIMLILNPMKTIAVSLLLLAMVSCALPEPHCRFKPMYNMGQTGILSGRTRTHDLPLSRHHQRQKQCSCLGWRDFGWVQSRRTVFRCRSVPRLGHRYSGLCSRE